MKPEVLLELLENAAEQLGIRVSYESLQTSVAAAVTSVALDPATGSLVLTTDPLGDIDMSDVERVL